MRCPGQTKYGVGESDLRSHGAKAENRSALSDVRWDVGLAVQHRDEFAKECHQHCVFHRIDLAIREHPGSNALDLVRQTPQGACLQFIDNGASISLEQLRHLGNALADAIEAAQLSHQHPLILLLESNLGKALGHYASRWGQTPGHLIVIDEIKQRQALFINVGKARQNIVPIAFYGIN